ncbi:jumonji, AT rich interactive domain 2 isoform X2 [Anticarsia gemmatalis]|uniref:jumonji, AT rich interactive domain 2 isoform X2 n=1 Tax=Anticarsia gemmatalis TaxID=129554 RepID=UPI003F776BDF
MRPTTRKVTAQRKFAQGAHLPPPPAPAAPPAPPPPERREPPPPNQETNVYVNRMSATNLLDVVCFQNVHTHYQPVVLVRRCDDGSNEASSPLLTRDQIKSSPAPSTSMLTQRKKNRKVHSPDPDIDLSPTFELPLMSVLRVAPVRSEAPRPRASRKPRRTIARADARTNVRTTVRTNERSNARPNARSIARTIARSIARNDSRAEARTEGRVTRHSLHVMKLRTQSERHAPQRMTPPLVASKRKQSLGRGKRTLPKKRRTVVTSTDESSEEGITLAALRNELVEYGCRDEIVEPLHKRRQQTTQANNGGVTTNMGPPTAPTTAASTPSVARPRYTSYLPASVRMNTPSDIDLQSNCHSELDVPLEPYMTANTEDTCSATLEGIGCTSKMSHYNKSQDSLTKQPQTRQAGPNEMQPGPSRIPPGSSRIQTGPSRIQPGPSETQSGPREVRPGPSEAQPGPSGVQPGISRNLAEVRPQRSSTFANTARSYYGEVGIRHWIDRSRPPNTDTGADGRDDDCSCDTPEITEACIAGSWKSIQAISLIPAPVFAARCKICRPCERISKLMQLTTLLKRQKKIECLLDDNNQPTGSRHAFNIRPESRLGLEANEHIFTELLPRHPHLMIIVKSSMLVDKQVFAASLIPRSEARGGLEFSLTDHEYLVDCLLETLSLNLGDPPPVFKKAPNPKEKQQKSPPPRPSSPSPKEDNIDEEKKKKEEKKKDTLIEDARVLWPTLEEFEDPIAFIESVWTIVSKYGMCKIMPPTSFTPACKTDENIRFEASNQYIPRLYNRWGPSARELCAIKLSLKIENVKFDKAPIIDGLEVNLPKLYQTVQQHGGFETVIDRRKWELVAEDMKFNPTPTTERKLDNIYVKYLIPYDTMSPLERQECMRKVEQSWNKKVQKLLARAMNPLHRKKRLLDESEASESDTEEDDTGDAEDCVTPGLHMDLHKYRKVAKSLSNNILGDKCLTTKQIEDEYWRTVILGNNHVVANAGCIDTGPQGYGFTNVKSEPYGESPWNLKNLTHHKANVLRSLGPVLGVTVPTLHLGMLFSTSCWHRDPHFVGWADYQHEGPTKVWYSIPESDGKAFRTAVEKLTPTVCQNKSLWLPSDITMIPPSLLRAEGVTVYRLEQNPGEFVIVMPGAYSCSISTGYTVSESVYFATSRWLDEVNKVFKDTRESCEPTMFSIEQLLKGIIDDPTTDLLKLHKIKPMVDDYFVSEIVDREQLQEMGVQCFMNTADTRGKSKAKKRSRQVKQVWGHIQHECDVCRRALFLSKVRHLPFRNRYVCLEHALQIIRKRNNAINLQQLELHFRVSTEELYHMVETVNERVNLTELPDLPDLPPETLSDVKSFTSSHNEIR